MRKKLEQIETEAYAFSCWEDGIFLPSETGETWDFEYVPEAVVLKRRVDHDGLPFAGGWAEQPYIFIVVLEAARRGTEQYEREKKGQEQNMLLKLLERK